MEGASPQPNEAGAALMAALADAKDPRKKKRQQPPTQLGTPPIANGQTVNGASTSTTRVGY